MSNHGHGETIQCNKLVIISWPANINHRITGVLISKHGKIKSSNRSYWASRVTVLVLYRYYSIFNTFYSTGFLIHLFDFRVLVFGFNEYFPNFLNYINFSLILFIAVIKQRRGPLMFVWNDLQVCIFLWFFLLT